MTIEPQQDYVYALLSVMARCTDEEWMRLTAAWPQFMAFMDEKHQRRTAPPERVAYRPDARYTRLLEDDFTAAE